MIDIEFGERIRQHFTKGELVEFLPISMSDLIDALEEFILEHYQDLSEEMCFEIEAEETDD